MSFWGRESEGKGDSDIKLMNGTLAAIDGLIRNLSIDRFREGALFALYKLSLGGDYVLTTCDPPARLIPDGLEVPLQLRQGGVPGLGGVLQLAHPPKGTPSSERPARPPTPPTWTTTGKRRIGTAIRAY